MVHIRIEKNVRSNNICHDLLTYTIRYSLWYIHTLVCTLTECNECILFLAECFIKTCTQRAHTHADSQMNIWYSDFFALWFYVENVLRTKICCACACAWKKRRDSFYIKTDLSKTVSMFQFIFVYTLNRTTHWDWEKLYFDFHVWTKKNCQTFKCTQKL